MAKYRIQHTDTFDLTGYLDDLERSFPNSHVVDYDERGFYILTSNIDVILSLTLNLKVTQP